MLVDMVKASVLFVCLGNICRSPTAEGVMHHLLKAQGLQAQVAVDSAGTGGYHVGAKADLRAREHAKKRGIELASRARQFQVSDFHEFNYILAMDSSNFTDLKALSCGSYDDRIFMFLDFDPNSLKGSSVPDPYYGGEDGFEEVLDLAFRGCQGLIDLLVAKYQLTSARA